MQLLTLLCYTFAITAIYDIILRYLSLHYSNNFPYFPFISLLKPYFLHHTLLAAALIAGFVGFFTEFIILEMKEFPTELEYSKIFEFLFLTAIVSAFIGIPMKYSGFFPKLKEYYYDTLDKNKKYPFRSMYHDGVSGLIVQSTLLTFVFFFSRQ